MPFYVTTLCIIVVQFFHRLIRLYLENLPFLSSLNFGKAEAMLARSVWYLLMRESMCMAFIISCLFSFNLSFS